ncbi:MAG: hypothetical protein Fur006_49960 [Coleofasciculaceae cyanobacterium]
MKQVHELDFISSLPRVPINQLKNLPATPGVYFALDDAERIWYVGKAVKQTLRDRLASHERLSDFKVAGVTHIAHLAMDEGDIDYYEENAKKRFAPPLNVEMSTPHLRRPAFIIDGLSPKQQAERFIECKRIIEEIVPPLELEMKAYKPNIVSYVEDSGGTAIFPEARFTLTTRKTWLYSCDLERLMLKIKAQQKAEQKTGVAQVVETSTFPVCRLAI